MILAIRPLAAAAALIVALSASPALPAPAPAPTDDGQIPDLVSALVIQATAPGPAWWKVTRGDAVVWILGTPPNLSDRIEWDQRALQRRLQGARLFLTPLYLTPQPYKADDRGRPLTGDKDYCSKTGETEADLPAGAQARLRAAYKTLSDRTISGDWSIIYATRQLNQALFNRVPLSTTALPTALQSEGAHARVPMYPTLADTIGASTDYTTGPVEAKIACLDATLTVAERGADALRKGIEAWATGDLPSAMATVGCVGAKGPIYKQEAVTVTSMLRSWLNNPGKSVAAVELVPLLMKDGVIERLTAAGYTIDGPDSKAVAEEYSKEVGQSSPGTGEQPS
ncbi:MAG: hypothetical protein JWM33_599 [Caulobacteraceae bacterium]|nr:hypothetical protein [Caulobacteraceae bacterium]